MGIGRTIAFDFGDAPAVALDGPHFVIARLKAHFYARALVVESSVTTHFAPTAMAASPIACPRRRAAEACFHC